MPPAAPPTALIASAFSVNDTIRHFDPRRVLALTDSSRQTLNKERTEKFYQKLQTFFYKTKLSRKLFDLIVVPSSDNPGPPPRESEKKQPAERFQSFQGKIIGDIHIRKLPVFGPSVTDTSTLPQNWFEKTGNQLHFPTRTWVIRKNMLFEKGDSLQPVQLSDNERVLRQLPFIRDARVYLQPRLEDPESDTVDVLVLTQDYFPYDAGGSFGGFDDLSLRIGNSNLAGLGHHFSNELMYNGNLTPQLGYRGVYTVPNLAGMFINTRLEFIRTALHQQEGLQLQRNFFTPDVKWAGGLHLNQSRARRGVLFLDASQDTLLWLKYIRSNAWLARAFSLNKQAATSTSSRTRLIIAARFSHTNYSERPPTTAREQHFFHHRRLFIGSIGINSRRYFRDHYIFGFGRTEDVPIGYQFNLRAGHENSEFYQRPYVGLQLQGSRYFRWFGYLRAEIDAESYFKNEGGAEQRVLHVNTAYFSPLLSWGDFRLRHLISFNYTYGDRRFAHEFLTIGYDHIRGFSTYAERGTQRFSFRLETISFTPFRILDFQLAAFGFADLAFLNRDPFFSLKGQSFQGYGLGLRVRNDHLTFNTFQIRAIVYPNTPGKSFGISLEGIPSQLFRDFEVGEPRPFLFR